MDDDAKLSLQACNSIDNTKLSLQACNSIDNTKLSVINNHIKNFL